MKKGNFVCIKPSITHYVSLTADTNPLIFTLALNRENFAILSTFYSIDYSFFSEVQIFSLTQNQLNLLNDEFDVSQTLNEYLRSNHIKNLISMLMVCSYDIANFQTAKNVNDVLASALQKMNYSEYLYERVTALCRISNYSRSHLCRLMKQIYHCTPHEYINSLRIAKAKYLLKNTDKSVLQISSELGFSSQSHFIGIFKKFYGTTPLKYKNSK